jgi:hypothetical protein
MKPACREKKVKTQTPLDATLQDELFVSAPHQENIELTEVVEEETPVDKESASATRKPASLPQGFELAREQPDPERQVLKNRAGSIKTVISSTASPEREAGAMGRGHPRAREKKDDAVLRATKDHRLDAGGQGAEDLEAAQILTEFFSSLEAGDLSEKLMESGGTFHPRPWEEPAIIKTDAFNELLEDMESIERTVTEETRESHSQAAEPVATARLGKADWPLSNTCHPLRIFTLRKFSELRTRKADPKKRPQDIRALLYASGSQLKRAVVRVFRTHRNV